MRFIKILLILLFPYSLLAQWSATPEIGANIIPTGKTDLGREFRLGWHVGGNVAYDFNDYFSLSSGLFASQKQQTYSSEEITQFELFGLEAQLDSFGLSRDVITKTNGVVSQFYLELPILATYTIGDFSFFGGPYIGYTFSIRRKEVENVQTPLLQAVDLTSFGLDPSNPLLGAFLPPNNETTLIESSSANGLRKLDIGFKVGAKYSMDQFSLGLAYQRGILDYELVSGKSETEVHQYTQITIGYRFDF